MVRDVSGVKYKFNYWLLATGIWQIALRKKAFILRKKYKNL